MTIEVRVQGGGALPEYASAGAAGADLRASDEIRLEAWQSRPVLEKLVGPICWILERQQ